MGIGSGSGDSDDNTLAAAAAAACAGVTNFDPTASSDDTLLFGQDVFVEESSMDDESEWSLDIPS